jgi:hypothetical protein
MIPLALHALTLLHFKEKNRAPHNQEDRKEWQDHSDQVLPSRRRHDLNPLRIDVDICLSEQRCDLLPLR